MKIVFSFLSVAFFLLFSAEKLSAQNLVPNPSFEDTVACPNAPNQVENAVGWSSFGQSPDYFNACSHVWNDVVSVPTNYFGHQNAATGNAYCGVGVYVNSGINSARETFGEQLSAPLISGIKYFANIKVSLADSSQFAIDKLGISFSTNPYYSFPDSVEAPLNNHAMVLSTSIISDTTNWITISGSFIADSPYQYIMIGNFYTDSQINSISVPSSSSSIYSVAYYYIDDVCVSPDSLECDLNPEGIYNLPQQQIAIYPNPATEQLIIDKGQLIIKGIELFDLVGSKMMDDELLVNNSNHYTINTKNFPRGYYFIRIHTSEGMINRKIVLQ